MICGQIYSGIHWSDTLPTDEKGFADQRMLHRNRLDKLKCCNTVFGYYGLSVTGRTGGFAVSDHKGRTLLCRDFGDLMVKAEQLAGRKPDPLDPGLIAYLNEKAKRPARINPRK